MIYPGLLEHQPLVGKAALIGKLYVDDILIRETETFLQVPSRSNGFGFIVEFNKIYHQENVSGSVLKIELIFSDAKESFHYLYGDACYTYPFYEVTNSSNNLYNNFPGITGLAKNINLASYFPELKTVQYIKHENNNIYNNILTKMPIYGEGSFSDETSYISTVSYYNAFYNRIGIWV